MAGVRHPVGMEAHASTPSVERRRAWARWAIIGLVGLFIALLVYGIESKGPDDAIDDALAEGHAPAAPAFTLEVLDSGEIPPTLRGPAGRSARRRAPLAVRAPRHPGGPEPLGLVVHALP